MSAITPATLSLGETWPSLEQFQVLAEDRRVIPVVRRFLADGETPIGVFRKLAGDRTGTFLLESADHAGAWSRYSIIGARCAATLTELDGQAHWIGQPPVGLPDQGDPLDALRDSISALATEPILGLPPLTSGLVGAITYDAVRHWERLPELAEDDLRIPQLTMMLATDLAIVDHADGTIVLVANAVNYDDTDERVDWAYADAVSRLDAMAADLAQPAASSVASVDIEARDAVLATVRGRTQRDDFLAVVDRAREDIRAGEVFQVVLAQRFDVANSSDSLDVYRALRASNPSPYMYLFRFPTVDDRRYEVVGSSPEALVRVTGTDVYYHPIAGSRPRGKTPEADVTLADDLRRDPKERAEHVMLVDLGRNDLQRVCRAGTVDVVDFLSVRRYSHVMHLESTLVGHLREGMTAFDVLAAAFPAGTLSGAPKPRAMELIETYEPTRRGVYGGAVGYLDFHGDMDMAIAIRTAVLLDDRAYVQAGAGIVADSDPASEHQECVNKAAAALRAVATAAALRGSG